MQKMWGALLMIDYEKLKIAHELFSQLPKDTEWYKLIITKNLLLHPNPPTYFWYEIICADGLISTSYFIDDMITKLTELTQPKCRYKVGDVVWYDSYYGELRSLLIEEIELCEGECRLKNNSTGSFICEDVAYESKNSLLDEKIKYLESLREN